MYTARRSGETLDLCVSLPQGNMRGATKISVTLWVRSHCSIWPPFIAGGRQGYVVQERNCRQERHFGGGRLGLGVNGPGKVTLNLEKRWQWVLFFWSQAEKMAFNQILSCCSGFFPTIFGFGKMIPVDQH